MGRIVRDPVKQRLAATVRELLFTGIGSTEDVEVIGIPEKPLETFVRFKHGTPGGPPRWFLVKVSERL